MKIRCENTENRFSTYTQRSGLKKSMRSRRTKINIMKYLKYRAFYFDILIVKIKQKMFPPRIRVVNVVNDR